MTYIFQTLLASTLLMGVSACGNAASADPDATSKMTVDATVDAQETKMATAEPAEAMDTAQMANTTPMADKATENMDGMSAKTSPNGQTGPAEAWTGVLGKRLSAADPETGLIRFDYKGFSESQAERQVLDGYIQSLASMEEPSDPAMAVSYWANLYNAVTIDVVADNYPVKSIREIKSGAFKKGPWDKELVTVNGKALTLNNIEHDIMRKKYSSPLIHYMVNCASVGCPNLRPTLWSASTLDADRDQAARDYINSPRGVNASGGKVEVSSIFKWYEEDFGGSKSGVIDHVRQYADSDLASALEGVSTYSSHDYDWSLNGN